MLNYQVKILENFKSGKFHKKTFKKIAEYGVHHQQKSHNYNLPQIVRLLSLLELFLARGAANVQSLLFQC